MTRFWLANVGVIALLCAGNVNAQHHHYNPRQHHSNGHQQTFNGPFDQISSGFGRHFGHHFGGPYFFGLYVVQPVQVTSYPYPVPYFPNTRQQVVTTSKPISPPATPAARMKSFEAQARGDQRMREQKWAEARAAYANAVSATPDRAEAHFRLAVCFVTIQRFDSAIREFKRAIDLDPKSVRTAKSLKSLFGPDGQIVKASILGKLGDWAKEDFHNADRLFLYGAMLRLDDNAEGIELLRSAMQANVGADSTHIATFLDPNADKGPLKKPGAGELPALNAQPVQVAIARPFADLRFSKSATLIPAADAPVPMPDGLVPVLNAPVPKP